MAAPMDLEATAPMDLEATWEVASDSASDRKQERGEESDEEDNPKKQKIHFTSRRTSKPLVQPFAPRPCTTTSSTLFELVRSRRFDPDLP